MSLVEKTEMENETNHTSGAEINSTDKQVNYYLLEFNKENNKFTSNPHKFKDTLDEIEKLGEVTLSELLVSYFKNNHILIPIYKGKLVKDSKYLSDFSSPILILKLDIRLLVKEATKPLSRNLLNMDISSIISTILNQSGSNYPPQTDNRDSDDDDETVNSQNDIVNMTSQLMNIYSNNMQSMQNIRRENMEKYKDEIEQMTNMGFDNREKIIQSLIVSNGNIEHAVNYYLTIN